MELADLFEVDVRGLARGPAMKAEASMGGGPTVGSGDIDTNDDGQ